MRRNIKTIQDVIDFLIALKEKLSTQTVFREECGTISQLVDDLILLKAYEDEGEKPGKNRKQKNVEGRPKAEVYTRIAILAERVLKIIDLLWFK